MPRYLVVPIDVEALCVNQQPYPAGTGFMPPITHFDRLPYGTQAAQEPFLGERVTEQPFNGGTAAADQPSINLHWAMPDGLMHGTQQTDAQGNPLPESSIKFLRLPDRWLVTRIVLGVSGVPSTQSWIVDSRYLSRSARDLGNSGSSAVPWAERTDTKWQQQPFRFLGRSVPLEQWAEANAAPSEYLSELTAASLGMIEAPAYYPSCRNVFGLCDTLDGLPLSQVFSVCYSVVGWHKEQGDDPVRGKSPDAMAAALRDLRWSLDDAGSIDGAVYVGSVHSVGWDPSRKASSPQPLTAVLGNTTNEALAALLTHTANGEAHDDLETQLHMLLTGQLDLLAESGGQRRATRQLHQQRFSPVPSTRVWSARRESDGSDVSSTLSTEVRDLLDDLNAKQQTADALRSTAADHQWQVFADWYKYLKCSYPEVGQSAPLDPDDVMDFMKQHPLPEAQDAVTACLSAQADADEARRKVEDKLPEPIELVQQPGGNYWRPTDPVLLLAGKDVAPAWRYGGDGRHSDGLLVCRTSDKLVDGVVVAKGVAGGTDNVSLNPGDAPGLSAGDEAPALDPDTLSLARAALVEACMLWPGWAAVQLAAKSSGSGSAAAITSWLTEQQDAFLDVKQPPRHVYSGVAPSIVGITGWNGNPWLPIMMHWRVDYTPVQSITRSNPTATLDPRMVLAQLVADNESLDADAVDLVVTGETHAQQTQYEGINIITPQAGFSVWKRLKDYATAHPKSPLAKLSTDAQVMPLLSQALAGVHDRFLLRRLTMQVEARDPFAQGGEWDFIATVRRVLSELGTRVNTMAPMVQDQFSPIRCGALDLDELVLVDAFGQYRSYRFAGTGLNRVIAARSLAPTAGATSRVFLPPRLSQPARLQIQWISAADDSIGTETRPASPICGWVVPNYLDGSLMVYDAAGEALGSLIPLEGKLSWLGSPANPKSFGVAPDQLFKQRNAHLRDFVLAFLGDRDDPEYLREFLNALNDAAATIHPLQYAQHAQLPVLVGQPLALVRAALTLEVMGVPAINQTWAAFENDVKGDGGRTTNEHAAVRWPVMLGNVSDPDDGLVGFYLDGASPFSTLYSVAGSGKGIVRRHMQTLTLSAVDHPLKLTMLVDPCSQIHATCGYLPAQTIQLPPEIFRAAFARIAVTFLTAPLLATMPPPVTSDSAVAVPLPMPGRQEGQWKWVRVVAAPGGTRQAIVASAEAPKPDQPLSASSLYVHEGWLSFTGGD